MGLRWNAGTPMAGPLFRFYARFGAAVALSTACFIVCVSTRPILDELLWPRTRLVVLGRGTTPNGDLVAVTQPAPGPRHFIRLLPCP